MPSGVAAVIYFSRAFDPIPRPANAKLAAQLASVNAKTGVWAVVLAFLGMRTPTLSEKRSTDGGTGYSVLQGPRTPLIRPHPALWKLVHGILLVYMMFLVYLLFQTVDDARLFLKVSVNGCSMIYTETHTEIHTEPLPRTGCPPERTFLWKRLPPLHPWQGHQLGYPVCNAV